MIWTTEQEQGILTRTRTMPGTPTTNLSISHIVYGSIEKANTPWRMVSIANVTFTPCVAHEQAAVVNGGK